MLSNFSWKNDRCSIDGVLSKRRRHAYSGQTCRETRCIKAVDSESTLDIGIDFEGYGDWTACWDTNSLVGERIWCQFKNGSFTGVFDDEVDRACDAWL